MHAFSHTSYHIISHTGIHSTDTQQHRDATHTYTRTYIDARIERHHMGRSVLPDSGSPEGKTEHETHCQGDNEHNSGEGYPTPPHPTQPKPDPSSVRVFASEHERYYPTPPHVHAGYGFINENACVCDSTFACVCESKTPVCVSQLSPMWMSLTPLCLLVESLHV